MLCSYKTIVPQSILNADVIIYHEKYQRGLECNHAIIKSSYNRMRRCGVHIEPVHLVMLSSLYNGTCQDYLIHLGVRLVQRCLIEGAASCSEWSILQPQPTLGKPSWGQGHLEKVFLLHNYDSSMLHFRMTFFTKLGPNCHQRKN